MKWVPTTSTKNYFLLLCNHVTYIFSVSGHGVPTYGGSQSIGMYAASKYAVTAINETLRQELQESKSKIRVTVSLTFHPLVFTESDV